MAGTAQVDPERVASVLVLQLSPIGDTLFGVPALRALRRYFRRARITSVTWHPNREILLGNPNVDRVITCRKALRLPRLLSELAEESFDVVVGLSNVGSWLTTLFSRVPVRVGFNSQTLGWSYSASVPDRRDRHAVDYCLDVVAALGVPSAGRNLEIALDETHRRTARRWVEATGTEPGRRELRVAMHPGGRYFRAKRWTPEGYASVADYLAGRYGARIVIVGGKDDVPLAQAITDGCGLAEPVVAAGQVGLKETAAILETCDLFIGNDSAPMHLATAVGTPVIGLFGPTDVNNFRPLGPFDMVVRKPLPCSPCFHWMGGSRQYLAALRYTRECGAECMRAIQPWDVIAAVEQQLDRLQLRRRLGLPERPAMPVPARMYAVSAATRYPGAQRLQWARGPISVGAVARAFGVRRRPRWRTMAYHGRHQLQEHD